ncbi:hypothetical protein [Streptomyces sp. NRRL F-5123]|uniref:hypothetical protein n=1 Tax=Streptomyces sp. NRRL F-5123 TaxID=1463856 RepID=UPI0004E16BEA|nr:hypothetical protein [Streptomyces sp. NRRL F-5123]
MAAQNPAVHARVAADALARLLRDVQLGRAEWTPVAARQATEDLTRLCEAAATAVQQLAAAHAGQDRPGPHTTQETAALNEAGQHLVTAATRLRHARRTLH